MSDAPYDLPAGVLGRRILAWIVDIVLIGVLVWTAWVLIFALGTLTLGLGFALVAGLPLIGGLYHVLFVAGGRCATPGQGLLDLCVRRDEDLGPPGLFRALVFTLGLWVTLGSAFVLLALAPFMPRKRAPHDIVAGVVVVRKRALTLAPASVNMRAGMSAR